MTAALIAAAPDQPARQGPSRLGLVLLARLACEDGATRSELTRDLGNLVESGKARDVLDGELAGLIRHALAVENKTRFRPSPAGLKHLADEVGIAIAPKSWTDLRDGLLTAAALGLTRESATRIKGLAKPDRLRGEILASAFGFKLRGAPSPSRLRSELALIALERAFGQKIKSGISPRTGFNAKTARLLACQLLDKPRDVGTDSRLVILLAAQVAAAPRTDIDSVRLALLRRYARSAGQLKPAMTESPRRSPPVDLAPVPAAPPPASKRPAAANRPGLDGFARAVQRIAKDHAEGWPGSRKAFVSAVWQAISTHHPDWGLSPIEFKAMLAEAHRTGHLVLATADLKDKSQLRQLQDSAIAYKNTVWHLIRVED
ncbi:MAG: hypothetical protein AB7O43_02430 [Hyphomicrobiaceae bacterium]